MPINTSMQDCIHGGVVRRISGIDAVLYGSSRCIRRVMQRVSKCDEGECVYLGRLKTIRHSMSGDHSKEERPNKRLLKWSGLIKSCIRYV